MTDAFDQSPQYSRFYPQRYSSIAIAQLDLMRDSAALWVPRFAAVPDDSNVSIPARRTWEGSLSLPPGSIVWAIKASSQDVAGVRLQVTDVGTGERWFAQPVRIDPVSGDAIPNQPWILPEPRLLADPGLLTVQVSNLAAVANSAQVVIYYATPSGNLTPQWALEHMNALRLLRQRGVFKPGSGSSSSSYGVSSDAETPWLTMPANGVPFRVAQAIETPADGSSAVNVSYTVPQGYQATIRALAVSYTEAMFLEGEGMLTWRLSIDGAYAQGYDAITTTIGSPSNPAEIQGAIRVGSGQTVEIEVDHATGSALPAGGTKCIAVLAGWLYPA